MISFAFRSVLNFEQNIFQMTLNLKDVYFEHNIFEMKLYLKDVYFEHRHLWNQVS